MPSQNSDARTWGCIAVGVILGFVMLIGFASVMGSDDVSDGMKEDILVAVAAGVVLVFFLARVNSVNKIKEGESKKADPNKEPEQK